MVLRHYIGCLSMSMGVACCKHRDRGTKMGRVTRIKESRVREYGLAIRGRDKGLRRDCVTRMHD